MSTEAFRSHARYFGISLGPPRRSSPAWHHRARAPSPQGEFACRVRITTRLECEPKEHVPEDQVPAQVPARDSLRHGENYGRDQVNQQHVRAINPPHPQPLPARGSLTGGSKWFIDGIRCGVQPLKLIRRANISRSMRRTRQADRSHTRAKAATRAIVGLAFVSFFKQGWKR